MSEIDSSRGQTRQVTLPPVVYLPCEEHVRDPSEAVIEFRNMDDGRIALMTYSALDRLHDCCGEQQPWLVVPTSQLEHLRKVQVFQEVLLDVPIPHALRTMPSGTAPQQQAQTPPVRHTAI